MKRVWLSAVMAAALLIAVAASFVAGTANARPLTLYQCGSGFANCFGIVRWGGADGLYSSASIQQPTCSSGTCTNSNGWGVNRDTWMADDSSWAQGQCTTFGVCWVENGVLLAAHSNNCSSNGTSLRDCYFWADMRPCGDGYHEHYGAPADSDYGTTSSFTTSVVNDSSYGNGSGAHNCGDNVKWNVSSSSHHYGIGVSDQSTWNPIIAKNGNGFIQIGVELIGWATIGSKTQTLPQTDWTFNQYCFWSSGVCSYNYQGNNGIYEQSDTPVVAWWLTPPSGSSSGGNWAGECTC